MADAVITPFPRTRMPFEGLPIQQLAALYLRKLAMDALLRARRENLSMDRMLDALDALDIADRLEASQRRSPEILT